VESMNNWFETRAMRTSRHLGARALVCLFVLVIVVFGFGPAALAAAGNNIFITQNAMGAGNGADCADALSASWFNNSANWGSGANQIGPGTTVHICGTITAPVGGSALSLQGGGSSRSPVTIVFESGAILQSARFGGASDGSCRPCNGGIDVNGFSYVTIDGNKTGIIQNTANGMGMANHDQSLGIYLKGSNLIVRNLTIKNIFMNKGSGSGSTDSSGQSTADIRVDSGSTAIELSGNTLLNSRAGIWSDTTGTVKYHNNILDDHAWQIAISGSNGAVQDIYDNDIGTYVNWAFPTVTYHTDGIIGYGNPNAVITMNIYNNYFHGDLGLGSPTGFVFCTYGGPGSGSKCNIFNNVLVGLGSMAVGHDALMYFHSSDGHPLGPHLIANNTFVGGGFQIEMDGDTTTKYTIKNNIFQGDAGGDTFFYHSETNSQPWNTITVNNNLYFSGRAAGGWNWNGQVFATITSWKSGCLRGGGECDSTSSTADPMLDPIFHLQAGSPSIGLGANMSNLGYASLNADKLGVLRSPTLAWDAGAYTFRTTASFPPPTGLTAIVQ